MKRTLLSTLFALAALTAVAQPDAKLTAAQPDAKLTASQPDTKTTAPPSGAPASPRASAQPSVRGRLTDTEGRPVAGAAVILLDTDSVYFAAAASDVDGRFAIASQIRPYRLLIQHLAYETTSFESAADDTGEIVLPDADAQIDAVVVEGERPIVRIEEGKLSYDLQAATKGKAVNNAYEALSRLPGMHEKDGALELAGMGGVTVILNGKPSTMSAAQLAALLRSTPVERIERAEVMYSAPPQYHVRGAAINLVMRRGAGHTFSGEVHGNYSNRFYDNWDAGGNVVYTAGKWSADATYSAGQGKSIQPIALFSRHTLEGTTHDITQRQRIVSLSTRHHVRTAFEYAPNGKGRLYAAYTGSFSPKDPTTTDAAGTFVTSHNDRAEEDALHNASLRYASDFGLDVSLDYTRYRTSALMNMRNRFADERTTVFDVASGQTIDRLSLKADREHQLAKGWQLTCGGAFDWAEDHDWQHYTLHEGEVQTEDTDSRLTEYTANLYAGFGRQFAKGSFSLSLSGEYYRLGGYSNWSLYPQANFSWTPGEKHLLQFSLSSDKTYPSYWEMQEAVSYIDGYSEIRGTPGLRPSKEYSGQAVYMYQQKYVFMLFWNETSDYFMQTGWQASDRLALVYQSLNWDTDRQWGANAILPFRAGRWLDARLTLTGLHMTQRSEKFYDIPFDRSKWVGIARLENTVRLARKPDITLDLSGYYQTPAIQGTFDVEPSWRVDAAAKWNFARGKATLSVRCTDIFESADPAVRIRFKGQHLDMDSGTYTRAVSVHFSLRFGGYKQKKERTVDTSRFGH